MSLTMLKSKNDAYNIMDSIMKGEYDTNKLVGFLVASEVSLLSRGVLRNYLEAVCNSATYQIETALFDKPVIDIVGTGGDGKHTANISTLASLICAATGLVNVAKYGNRSASGICGSMDLLEALGIDIELSKEQVISKLKTLQYAPLYARAIYPGGRFVADARKQVSKPTIFNLLFPLARPILGEQYFIFGCATQEQMDTVEKIYSKEQNIRCLIVHGFDQTDEISISGIGKTKFRLIDHGQVEHGVINCKEIFGISPIDLELLQVNTKDEAVEIFKKTLEPSIKNKKVEAVRNSALVNAAVALFIALEEGQTDLRGAKKYFSITQDALVSGKVFKLVENFNHRKDNL